jgi:DNA polymerase elongation subunit (family B)
MYIYIDEKKLKVPFYNTIGQEVNMKTDVISFTDLDNVPECLIKAIDWKKMINKDIVDKVGEIMEVAGIPWDEILTGKKQISLEKFF